MVVPVVPMHMGAMHPFEQAMTATVAIAPFAVLGVVVLLRRRADEREAAEAAEKAEKVGKVDADTLEERTP